MSPARKAAGLPTVGDEGHCHTCTHRAVPMQRDSNPAVQCPRQQRVHLSAVHPGRGPRPELAVSRHCGASDSSSISAYSTWLYLVSEQVLHDEMHMEIACWLYLLQIIYDPDPNPKNEEQAIARSHRIGQTREVQLFAYLHCIEHLVLHIVVATSEPCPFRNCPVPLVEGFSMSGCRWTYVRAVAVTCRCG
jgi:hypothetical protein